MDLSTVTPSKDSRKILVVMQFWSGDRERAEQVARFMADIEPEVSSCADFMFAGRGCAVSDATAEYVGTKFSVVRRHTYDGPGEGWPDGTTVLWFDVLKQAKSMSTVYKAVVTLEPDDTPLRIDWLQALSDAWDAAPVNVLGAFSYVMTDHKPTKQHINGNAMWSTDPDFLKALYRMEGATPAGEAWDVHLAPFFRGMGWGDTPLVQSRWNLTTASAEYLEKLVADKVAYLHGVKDDSAFLYARELLAPIPPIVRPVRDPRKILLVLQYFEGDKDAAHATARLIADVQPRFSQEADFLLVRQPGTTRDAEVVRQVSSKFYTFEHTQRIPAAGWPPQSNAFFLDTAAWLFERISTKTLPDYKAVLLLEFDDVPLRPDWISMLSAEWDKKQARVVGCVVDNKVDVWHINGNLLMSTETIFLDAIRSRGMPAPASAWDVVFAPMFRRWGAAHTSRIASFWRKETASDEFMLEQVRNGVVMLHGIRDSSARRWARVSMGLGMDDMDLKKLPSVAVVAPPSVPMQQRAGGIVKQVRQQGKLVRT